MAEEFENINGQAEAQEAKAEGLKGKAEELKENISEKAEELKENISEKAEDLKEKADEFKENVKEKAEEFKENVKEKAEDARDKAEEAIDKVKAEIDDYTEEIDPEDIKKNKVMAVLSYFGILVLIPILCAKNSKFARFHANQGLVLFIIEALVFPLLSIIFKGWVLLNWILGLLGLVIFVFAVLGIVYAVQGKAKEIPILGNIKILK